MPAILKSSISTIGAAQFVNNLINSDSNIYIAVGKEVPWSNENTPTTPIDNIVDDTSFRNDIIGIKRVNVTNVRLMVPRVDWAEGMTFSPINDDNAQPLRATNYYCRTKLNYVYQCVGKSAEGIVTSAGSEPDTRDTVTTLDGYTWKFLYDIDTQTVNSGLLTEAWMPVPYNKHGVYPGGTITENQHYYGDSNANFTLGAYRVLISVTIADEGEAIPFTCGYRQAGLIYDPLDENGDFLAGERYSASDFDRYSGQLFFIDNFRLRNRAEGQSEQLQCLVSF